MTTTVYATKAFVGAGASLAQVVSVFLIGSTLTTSGYLGYRELVDSNQIRLKNVGFLVALTGYALSVPTLMYFIGVKPLVIRIVQNPSDAKICLETTGFFGRRRMSKPLDLAKTSLSASRFPGLVNISSSETNERFFLPSIQGFKTPEFRAKCLANGRNHKKLK
ncbi:hypothetical protein BASA82_000647 [Batrachochytrium salamandrivorans]|nr:hypothetical protein BASA82_000647 [Batrachochytrium salamandrivorans]